MQPSRVEPSRAERARCTRLCPRGCRLAVSWESRRRVCTVVLEAVTLPCIAGSSESDLAGFATLFHPPTRLHIVSVSIDRRKNHSEKRFPASVRFSRPPHSLHVLWAARVTHENINAYLDSASMRRLSIRDIWRRLYAFVTNTSAGSMEYRNIRRNFRMINQGK